MPSTEEVTALLDELNRANADSLETQTLDFKEWSREGMNVAVSAVVEHVVCMANGGGGTIVMGVHDKRVGRAEAILGVPAAVNTQQLRRSVYDKTSPQIMPTIDVIEVPEGTGRILAIHVSGDFPPYTDTQGRAKIRIDTDCLPLTGPRLSALMVSRADIDITARELDGTLEELLSPSAMESLRGIAARAAPEELLALSDRDLLRSIGLLSDNGRLLAGGLLLAGKPEQIARVFPGYQWSFLRMKPSGVDYENPTRERTALAVAIPEIEKLIVPFNPITTVDQGLLHLEFRKYPTVAVREALMNAFAHANYRASGVIQVELSDDRLVVSNPGGFVGGVTDENFLRHAPVARNATLMNALISLNLTNRNTLGVKRMYRAMLLDGKEPPVIRDVGESVRVVFLGTDFSVPFRAFVEQQMLEGFRMSLEHLLVLEYILRHGEIDLATASEICQQSEREAKEMLRQLVTADLLEALRRGQQTHWVLATRTARALRSGSAEIKRPLTKVEAAMANVLSTLESRSEGIGSAEVRQLTGFSPSEAKHLLRTMKTKKLIESMGRGPAARWHLVGGE